MTWNWQQPDWPNFKWDRLRISAAEEQCLLGAGVTIGPVKHLGEAEQIQLLVQVMSGDAVTSYSVQMPLSKIEEFLFCAGGNSAQLLTNFRFANGRINLLLEPVSADQGAPGKVMQATFANAVIESIEEDESEREPWPLDIIGFDCFNQGQRWRFVLNCGGVEWSWSSEWPSLRP